MITRIDNDADHFATLQAVDLDTSTKLPTLLAALSTLAPEDEDFEIIIRKTLLQTSYRCNPSMLARHVQAKICEHFQSCGTYSIGTQHIGFKFMRGEKPEQHHVRPLDGLSVMAQTRVWLDSDKEEPLVIPIHTVPSHILARPEQFVYQVRRVTGDRIRIQKFKTTIKITLK